MTVLPKLLPELSVLLPWCSGTSCISGDSKLLRSAGWRRVAGRNMAGAAGGRSRWLRPVSCGARGSALRWCCAAGTGREVLAPCAPPCVVLPQPRTHVIHMAGAVRLRLSCDAREFREGACSGHYVAARLCALSGCFI